MNKIKIISISCLFLLIVITSFILFRPSKYGDLKNRVVSIACPAQRLIDEVEQACSTKPAPNIEVNIYHGNDKIASTRSDSNGYINLKLPVGDYLEIINPNNISSVTQNFSISDSKTTSTEIKFNIGLC